MLSNRHHRRCRRCSGDTGLALPLLALMLVVLMVFAAFAVDLGQVFAARRLDQNAADAGALAGAQELTNPTGSDLTIVQQARQYAQDTLGYTFTDAEWNSCTLQTGFIAVPYTTAQNCVQRTADKRRVLLRLPTRKVSSTFGSVIGLSGYDHTAFAIAGWKTDGFGGVLPFGLGAGSGGGDGLICMKDAPGGLSIPPCNGPDSGNFQYLDFFWFGSADLGTTTICNGQDTTRLANNMAVGVDHDLSKYTGTEILEGAQCGTAAPQDPNTLFTETGNKQSAFGSGIYSGSNFSDGQNARLQRTDSRLFNGGGSTRSIAGHTLDDNPLWNFIDPNMVSKYAPSSGTADVPPSCEKRVFTHVLTNDYSVLPTAPADVRTFIQSKPKTDQMRLLLQRCFQHYNGQAFTGGGSGTITPPEASPCPVAGCKDPVFAANTTVDNPEIYDIQLTSRFGYVPQMQEADLSGGNSKVHIVTFRAVFIQRLLGGCSANNCTLDFEPSAGQIPPQGSTSNGDANAVTAFVFPATMLPNGLAGSNAPFQLGTNRFIQLLR